PPCCRGSPVSPASSASGRRWLLGRVRFDAVEEGLDLRDGEILNQLDHFAVGEAPPVLEGRFEDLAGLLVAENPPRLRVGELAIPDELTGLEHVDVVVLEKLVADEREFGPA